MAEPSLKKRLTDNMNAYLENESKVPRKCAKKIMHNLLEFADDSATHGSHQVVMSSTIREWCTCGERHGRFLHDEIMAAGFEPVCAWRDKCFLWEDVDFVSNESSKRLDQTDLMDTIIGISWFNYKSTEAERLADISRVQQWEGLKRNMDIASRKGKSSWSADCTMRLFPLNEQKLQAEGLHVNNSFVLRMNWFPAGSDLRDWSLTISWA